MHTLNIYAGMKHFKDLNDEIRNCTDKDIIIDNCIGQRYIGSGLRDKNIVINGTPGNALGSYLDGCTVRVYGNTQEATGDTMNSGTLYIHGSSGDATGYAMRGGKIFIEKDAGYRTGIHIKAYKEHKPAIVIGGSAGSFLGEYQAGGTIVVLGLNTNSKTPVGRFCGTGMHGGKIFIRCDELPFDLPVQISAKKADKSDIDEILPLIDEYCEEFNFDKNIIFTKDFYVLTADTKNPYKQLYTRN